MNKLNVLIEKVNILSVIAAGLSLVCLFALENTDRHGRLLLKTWYILRVPQRLLFALPHSRLRFRLLNAHQFELQPFPGLEVDGERACDIETD